MIVFALLGMLSLSTNVMAGKFDAQMAKFVVKFKGDILPYEVMSVAVLPGEELVFELPLGPSEYEVKVPQGTVARIGTDKWEWKAPAEKGLYPVKISNKGLTETVTVKVFVMVPYNEMKDGVLNGFRIGAYPSRPLKNNPIYEVPKGFVEVTKENRDTHVSPHFKLKHFISKQTETYPMYLIFEERLLLKLELILERVNDLGYSCDTLYLMSAYRTPFYNKAIGNVLYSLHQWGNAADIFIDDDDNGMIDDLNKDRRIDTQDAQVLHDIIDGMHRDPRYKAFVGGLGLYSSTPAHGPFVHVDVRGKPAFWGHQKTLTTSAAPKSNQRKIAQTQRKASAVRVSAPPR
jgi:hypothetical protein